MADKTTLRMLVACVALVQSIRTAPGAEQGGANTPGRPRISAGSDPAQSFHGGSSGSGALSPSVAASWEAHFDVPAGRRVADPSSGPMILDLLVLWRGAPGFGDANIMISGGGSDSVHRLQWRGHSLELRFDRVMGTVSVQQHVIPLAGANVVLLDDVENVGGPLVAGTVHVDPRLSGFGHTQGGAPLPPMSQIIRRSAKLFEYLRCDRAFTDASDPQVALKLRACSALRP
jgi:hypothetical protein